MVKTYVDERRYDILDRVSIAIFLAFVLWAISTFFGIPHLSLFEGIITNLFLAFCVEYSFEFKNSELKVRSSGKFYDLDGVLLIITWPFAKLFSILGMENKPVMGYIMVLVYLYGMIFHGWQIFDSIYHMWVMYYLYKNRKTNK